MPSTAHSQVSSVTEGKIARSEVVGAATTIWPSHVRGDSHGRQTANWPIRAWCDVPPDRSASMTGSATTQRGERPNPPASTGASRAPGLLRRDDVLVTLDRATEKKVTVISAPPG